MSFRKPCHMPFGKLIPSFTLTDFRRIWSTSIMVNIIICAFHIYDLWLIQIIFIRYFWFICHTKVHKSEIAGARLAPLIVAWNHLDFWLIQRGHVWYGTMRVLNKKSHVRCASCFHCRLHLKETTGVSCTGFSTVKQIVKPVKFTRDSGCLADESNLNNKKDNKYVCQLIIC